MITIERKKLEQALHELEGIPVYKKYGVRISNAITAIKEALAQPAQEPVAWKNAAIRLGEELSSVGPDGYYDMTAKQWLDWAMDQEPRGKNSLAQPAQEPVAQWQKRHHLWTEGAWENSEEHDAKQWRDKAQGWEIRALYITPQQQEPRNFCPRCGKRTADLTVIHTCTPPRGLEMT